MCGIAGFITSVDQSNCLDRLRAMTDTISHRGPDGEGFFITQYSSSRTIALGHRRLSIIDVAGGKQPFIDSKTQTVIIYNGEIYNYKELRVELQRRGHTFCTESDTEVALRSYLEWNEAAFQKFRGMFALGIWSPRQKQLVMARDPFGKKPLFYAERENVFLFASEPKSIIAAAGSNWNINKQAIAHFMYNRYVPGPATFFEGIKKVNPGSWARHDESGYHETRYYYPPYSEQPSYSSDPNPVPRFTNALEDAVRVRMQSDVPYGAFLSGGIDSASVVALMQRNSSSKVRTFSIGLDEEQLDETPYADEVAKAIGTEHCAIRFDSNKFRETLPKILRAQDGPITEPSNVAFWMLSKLASGTVKMVLTGEGADELLGGYPKYIAEKYGVFYRALVPQQVRSKLLSPLASQLPSRFWRVKLLVEVAGIDDDAERMSRWMSNASSSTVHDLLPWSRNIKLSGQDGAFDRLNQRTMLQKALLADQMRWLPDNLLERGDRLTMAASIEGRMPFMDTDLARFVSTLSDDWRVRGTQTKVILRQAMKEVLPQSILKRPKNGFRIPVGKWFRTTLRDLLHDNLRSSTSVSPIFCERSVLYSILDEHDKEKQNHEKLLWSILALELFLKEYSLSV